MATLCVFVSFFELIYFVKLTVLLFLLFEIFTSAFSDNRDLKHREH